MILCPCSANTHSHIHTTPVGHFWCYSGNQLALTWQLRKLTPHWHLTFLPRRGDSVHAIIKPSLIHQGDRARRLTLRQQLWIDLYLMFRSQFGFSRILLQVWRALWILQRWKRSLDSYLNIFWKTFKLYSFSLNGDLLRSFSALYFYFYLFGYSRVAWLIKWALMLLIHENVHI